MILFKYFPSSFCVFFFFFFLLFAFSKSFYSRQYNVKQASCGHIGVDMTLFPSSVSARLWVDVVPSYWYIGSLLCHHVGYVSTVDGTRNRNPTIRSNTLLEMSRMIIEWNMAWAPFGDARSAYAFNIFCWPRQASTEVRLSSQTNGKTTDLCRWSVHAGRVCHAAEIEIICEDETGEEHESMSLKIMHLEPLLFYSNFEWWIKATSVDPVNNKWRKIMIKKDEDKENRVKSEETRN